MTHTTIAVHHEERFALTIEDGTGRCCVSIPVSNRLADYEEFYEVDHDTFEGYRANLDSARDFVLRCRNREMDHLLIERPGRDRGVAT
jgi:hypothetical protein